MLRRMMVHILRARWMVPGVLVMGALSSARCGGGTDTREDGTHVAAASSAGGESGAVTDHGQSEAGVTDGSADRHVVPPSPPSPPFCPEAATPFEDGVGARVPFCGTAHLSPFFRALRRADRGEGKARVTVYGASHIASDWVTGFLRDKLQARFGDGGHGFVVPVKPWKSYRHFGISFEGNWRRWDTLRIQAQHTDAQAVGLAGVAVQTERAGTRASLIASVPRGETSTRYGLYYWKQPGGGELSVRVPGQGATRLSLAADTGSPGYSFWDVKGGGEETHRLDFRVRGVGKVRLFGVDIVNGGPGVIVDMLGINGSRARYHLLWDDHTYREHLKRVRPDLLVLAYGTNEAGDSDVPMVDYKMRVRRVLTRIQEVLPEASCMLVGPTDRPNRDRDANTVDNRPRTLEVARAQEQLAREFRCAFFDLQALMGGPLSMVSWVEAGLGAPDHVHLTRDGYQRVAGVFHDNLLRAYDRYKSAH